MSYILHDKTWGWILAIHILLMMIDMVLNVLYWLTVNENGQHRQSVIAYWKALVGWFVIVDKLKITQDSKPPLITPHYFTAGSQHHLIYIPTALRSV